MNRTPSQPSLILSELPNQFAVCRLDARDPLPKWVEQSNFYSVTRTDEELSIVCEEEGPPPDIKSEKGWRVLKVKGPLDFSLTGILASLAAPLANAQISLFAISTFNTDYILVRDKDLVRAKSVLQKFGHHFSS